jgi:hypothetical protein
MHLATLVLFLLIIFAIGESKTIFPWYLDFLWGKTNHTEGLSVHYRQFEDMFLNISPQYRLLVAHGLFLNAADSKEFGNYFETWLTRYEYFASNGIFLYQELNSNEDGDLISQFCARLHAFKIAFTEKTITNSMIDSIVNPRQQAYILLTKHFSFLTTFLQEMVESITIVVKFGEIDREKTLRLLNEMQVYLDFVDDFSRTLKATTWLGIYPEMNGFLQFNYPQSTKAAKCDASKSLLAFINVYNLISNAHRNRIFPDFEFYDFLSAHKLNFALKCTGPLCQFRPKLDEMYNSALDSSLIKTTCEGKKIIGNLFYSTFFGLPVNFYIHEPGELGIGDKLLLRIWDVILMNHQIITLGMDAIDFSNADKAFSAFFKSATVLRAALLSQGHVSQNLSFYIKIKKRVRKQLRIWNMEKERIRMINILGTNKNSLDKPQSFEVWTGWVAKNFLNSDSKNLSAYIKEFDS